MPKLTLSDVSNLLGNPTSAAATINSNSDAIEVALENTLSRDGTTPNQMESDLDMNHNDILNVKTLQVQDLTFEGGEDAVGILEKAQTAADEAEFYANIAEDAAASIGSTGRSDYQDIPSFVVTDVPVVVERARVGQVRDLANFIPTTAPAVDPMVDPSLPTSIFERHKRLTADGRWWEPTGIILTPEMFLHSTDGDNWAPAFQRMTNSAEIWGSNVIALKPSGTYEFDDQFVIKPGQIWYCYGPKLIMRSNPQGRGGFVRTQGSGSNIDADFLYRNDMVIYGMWAEIAPGIKGVNCFGTTTTDRVTFVDCVAVGAIWGLPTDPIKKGGRGFSCHPKSRYIKHINCRVFGCSIGFHVSDKADYNPGPYHLNTNPTATPVVEGMVATPGNPTVFTVAPNPDPLLDGGHCCPPGSRYFGQRFSGTWVGINGVEWPVTVIDKYNFSIPFNSTSLTWNSAGRLSKADTGVMRSMEIMFDNCVAEECDIAGIIFEQVIDSQNTDIPKNISFVNGRLINCGNSYPTHQGIIILSGLPGVTLDVQVYNDSSHPVGSVLRGGAALSKVHVRGKVHTATNMIDNNRATSGGSSLNLDEGTAEHPQGTSRTTEYKFAMEFNTVTGDLITTSDAQASETSNQNYTWRSRYDIEYSAVSVGGAIVNPLVKHATNDFRIKNIATGAITNISATTYENNVNFSTFSTTGAISIGAASSVSGNWTVTGSVIASGNVVATGALIGASVRTAPVAVGSLPTAASAGSGSRRLVSDANATTFNSVVAGGGANIVPVYSDGTNWRIG